MPVSSITMRKIKDVLRLKLDAKLSHQQIATALGISKGVVTKYVGLAGAAGLDWPTVQALDEVALERRLLVAPEQPREHVQPDFGRLHQALRGKGMTLMLLWEEHRADHADAQTYSYSQFCENYRRFAKQLKGSMRQIHRAGEKLFIDYAGPTIALTDGRRAHIFVAALGASSYTYACATLRETMVGWLESTARALAFCGGVPQLIVPDSPKAEDVVMFAMRHEQRRVERVHVFDSSLMGCEPSNASFQLCDVSVYSHVAPPLARVANDPADIGFRRRCQNVIGQARRSSPSSSSRILPMLLVDTFPAIPSLMRVPSSVFNSCHA